MLRLGHWGLSITFKTLPSSPEALTDAFSGLNSAIQRLERKAGREHLIIGEVTLSEHIIVAPGWLRIKVEGETPHMEITTFQLYTTAAGITPIVVRVERQVAGQKNRSGAWRVFIDGKED